MTEAPETLKYQGQELILLSVKYFSESEEPQLGELNGMIRYSYGIIDKRGNQHVKLMQFSFNGKPIDWERLQAENSQAPVFEKRSHVMSIQAYQAHLERVKRYREKKRAERIASGNPPRAYKKKTRLVMKSHDEFIAEMESWE